MLKATLNDKEKVVNLLACSFDNNKSVNYIIKQDSGRLRSLKALMAYSFDICHHYGEVFISDDRKASVLILLPEIKKTDLRAIWLDARLAFSGIGLWNVPTAMKREAAIKEIQPNSLLYYLWFIGVEPGEQGKGIGSALLKEVIARGKDMNRVICLETSTTQNLPWYARHGFKIYAEKDFGYPLYFLKQ